MNSHFLNDILECSVCLKPLDEQNKVLPCQHTFCKSCLLSIVRSQKELRCPECRVVVQKHVDELPSNILLIRLLDGIKLQQNQILAHSEKQARRHSVEGILSDPDHTNVNVKDGEKQLNKQRQQNSTRPVHAAHDRPTSAPQPNDTMLTTRPYSRAVHTYKSDHPSDLSFVKGDTVHLLKKIDDNWMSGECNGRKGVFPTNYVKVIQPLPAARPFCTALYDFESKEEDQDRDCLLFSKNDKILVIRRVDENWAEGILRDKIGIFPLSFVKLNDEAKTLIEVTSSPTRPQPERAGDDGDKSSGIKGVLGMGAAARRIVSNRQGGKNPKKRHSFPTLSARKAKEDGPSTSHRHSMEILEGGSHDLTSVDSAAPHVSNQSTSSQDAPARLRHKRPQEITVPPTVLTDTTPGTARNSSSHNVAARNPSASTSSASNVVKDHVDRSRSSDQSTPRQTSTSSKLHLATGLVTASYSYQALKPDELELIKGDSYRVLEVCKDGWCKGVHIKSGKSGVFPGNYVVHALSTSSAKSPVMPSRPTSGSSSSLSSSSSASPVQAPKTNKTNEPFSRNGKSHVRHHNQHHKSIASSNRTPPPRPAAPALSQVVHNHLSNTRLSKSDASSSSSSRSSSSAHNSAPKLKIDPSGSNRSSDKDKKKDKGQLLLKLIGGTKRTKTPASPTSPIPRLAQGSASHDIQPPSTSQSKPALKPLMRDKYRAFMNYPANEPEELELKKGDIIIVHKRRDDGWFHGTEQREGKSGLFPSTFVKRVTHE